MIVLKGNLVTLNEVFKGFLAVEKGCIQQISKTPIDADKVYDFQNDFILPGFIDIHMHGQGDYGTFETEDIVSIANTGPT